MARSIEDLANSKSGFRLSQTTPLYIDGVLRVCEDSVTDNLLRFHLKFASTSYLRMKLNVAEEDDFVEAWFEDRSFFSATEVSERYVNPAQGSYRKGCVPISSIRIKET